MDAKGIGTDATIAQHIKTIQERRYAVRNEQMRFEPTELGLALVEGYDAIGFTMTKVLNDCVCWVMGWGKRWGLAFVSCSRRSHSHLNDQSTKYPKNEQPDLRALMEAECKRIARGQLSRYVSTSFWYMHVHIKTKTKPPHHIPHPQTPKYSEEMVRACLERMQECYEVCHGQAGRIVEAVARHFRQLGQGRVRKGFCFWGGGGELCVCV